MKFYAIVLTAAVSLLLLCPPVSAQFQNPNIEDFGPPNEFLLAAPNPSEGTQIIPVGIDLYNGNDDNTIHFGLTPPNSSSKPVLVFVHGYASNASVWYNGDDNMYHDVYQDGYRAAFVSLTPNRHIWTNGFMLNRIIDRVTQYYGVSDVVVIGWSKGGVDTDAAIVHFGANGKVSQAFTLSTPHNGTYVAELANSWLLSLVNIIFMQDNDATRSLTRGYLSFFRSITDNNPNNTVGYTTLGGWGNGPLARLSIPQDILYLNGGSKSSGGNDGVVPYSSSLRPGGTELFGGQYKAYGWFGIPYYPGPSETELDHFEVTRGDLVWPYIKGTLNGTLRTAQIPTPSDYNPNATVSSHQQIVTSLADNQTFVVEEGAEMVHIQLLGTEASDLQVTGDQGAAALQRLADGFWQLNQPAAGTYRIATQGEFVALVSVPNGPEARLHTGLSAEKPVYPLGSAMEFTVDLPELKKEFPADLRVTAVLHRTMDLALNQVDAAPMVLEFKGEGQQFSAQTGTDLADGVYSITVNVRSEAFARTIVTSVAHLGNAAAKTATPQPQLDLAAWPNPFSEQLHLDLEVEEDFAGELTIYNVLGVAVKSLPVNGTDEVVWNARSEGHAAGVYIVELNDGARKMTRKVVLR
ncbi:MAG: T9SS type A sorting domain-containing protein [Bacteroidota bacterium]